MIPRLFLVIGVDIELAGLWLAMDSPAMPFGFARYGSAVVSLSCRDRTAKTL
jgi:hypothetical protein